MPQSDVLGARLNAVRSKRLRQILGRHLDSDRAERFGTPDFFFFARKSGEERPAFYRLVEVKRPKERFSNYQRDEID
ncbi:VRR-NUC domain-containing protein [Minwuia sp.]|uniref:VRR-NUC domain-containing protein n=1 Tax=Minwuia sp. TaxID=2493630 RepID=UPI003A918F68